MKRMRQLVQVQGIGGRLGGKHRLGRVAFVFLRVFLFRWRSRGALSGVGCMVDPRSCSDIHLGECGHVGRGFLSPESEAFAPFLPDAVSRVLGG